MNFLSIAPAASEAPKIDLVGPSRLPNTKVLGQGAFEDSLKQFSKVGAQNSGASTFGNDVASSRNESVDPKSMSNGSQSLADSQSASKEGRKPAEPINAPRRESLELVRGRPEPVAASEAKGEGADLGEVGKENVARKNHPDDRVLTKRNAVVQHPTDEGTANAQTKAVPAEVRKNYGEFSGKSADRNESEGDLLGDGLSENMPNLASGTFGQHRSFDPATALPEDDVEISSTVASSPAVRSEITEKESVLLSTASAKVVAPGLSAPEVSDVRTRVDAPVDAGKREVILPRADFPKAVAVAPSAGADVVAERVTDSRLVDPVIAKEQPVSGKQVRIPQADTVNQEVLKTVAHAPVPDKSKADSSAGPIRVRPVPLAVAPVGDATAVAPSPLVDGSVARSIDGSMVREGVQANVRSETTPAPSYGRVAAKASTETSPVIRETRSAKTGSTVSVDAKLATSEARGSEVVKPQVPQVPVAQGNVPVSAVSESPVVVQASAANVSRGVVPTQPDLEVAPEVKAKVEVVAERHSSTRQVAFPSERANDNLQSSGKVVEPAPRQVPNMRTVAKAAETPSSESNAGKSEMNAEKLVQPTREVAANRSAANVSAGSLDQVTVKEVGARGADLVHAAVSKAERISRESEASLANNAKPAPYNSDGRQEDRKVEAQPQRPELGNARQVVRERVVEGNARPQTERTEVVQPKIDRADAGERVSSRVAEPALPKSQNVEVRAPEPVKTEQSGARVSQSNEQTSRPTEAVVEAKVKVPAPVAANRGQNALLSDVSPERSVDSKEASAKAEAEVPVAPPKKSSRNARADVRASSVEPTVQNASIRRAANELDAPVAKPKASDPAPVRGDLDRANPANAARSDVQNVAQRVAPVMNQAEPGVTPTVTASTPVATEASASSVSVSKAVAAELGQQSSRESREEKKRSKREAAVDAAIAARPGASSSLNGVARPISIEAAPSVLMQKVIESIDQMTKAVQRNYVRLAVELEGGDQVRVALRMSKNSVKTVFHTESDALRVAIREGWDQFQKQAASRGLDAQLPDFSSSSSEGGNKERAESEFEESIREELSLKRMAAELKGELSEAEPASEVAVAAEDDSELGLRRYA